MARLLVNHLGIRSIEINIKSAVDGVLNEVESGKKKWIELRDFKADKENLPLS